MPPAPFMKCGYGRKEKNRGMWTLERPFNNIGLKKESIEDVFKCRKGQFKEQHPPGI